MHALAIARIAPDGAPAGWSGTAFLVSTEYALTARHVLCPPGADGLPASEPTDSAMLTFTEGITVPTALEREDTELDVALLRLKRPCSQLRAVPIGDAKAVVGDPVLAVGWPHARPFRGNPEHILAYVVSSDSAIFDGTPAVKLQSPEAVHGKRLEGLSGGPVLLRTSGGLSLGTGFSVGIVRWNQLGVEGPVGGAFYATPISAVLDRWPELRRLLPIRRGLPSASKIGRFLARQLGTVDEPVPFGGRRPEIDRLTRWLRTPEGSPCMLVTAPSGAGKSTLLARWWQQLAAEATPTEETSVFVPVSIRYEMTGAETVFRALVARLAAVHGDDPLRAAGMGTDQLRDQFAEYLTLPAPGQGTLVVVIDGLDESVGWDASETLFVPDDFGPGVRVVVSARLTERRPTPEAWRDALGWSSAGTETLLLPPLTSSGVGEVLRSLTPPVDEAAAIAAQPLLTTLTRGDALALALYLQDLRDCTDPYAWLSDLEHRPRPAGLDGYMQRWWTEQEAQWEGPLASRGIHVGVVYSLLACAMGPLPRRDLLLLAKQRGMPSGDELDAALRDLKRWIVVDSVEISYVLSHPRLADHRRQELERNDELGAYDEIYLAWGRTTLEAVQRSDDAARDARPYPVRFYGAHLERAGATAMALFELVCPAWRLAWDFATDTFQGHLTDVRRAFRAAEAENDALIGAGRPTRLLPQQVACRAAVVDASQSAALMSPELVAQLRRHRLWSDRQAFGYVQSLTSSYERARALHVVAPWLTDEVTDDVAALYAAFEEDGDPDNFTEAISGYLRHLGNNSQMTQATEILASIPPPLRGSHVTACLELAQSAPEDLRFELVRAVLAEARDRPDEAVHIIQRLTSQIDLPTAVDALADPDPASLTLDILGTPRRPLADLKTVEEHSSQIVAVAPWLLREDLAALGATTVKAFKTRRSVDELDEEIGTVRRRKDAAIDEQDFESAAELREQEKELLARKRTAWDRAVLSIQAVTAVSHALSDDPLGQSALRLRAMQGTLHLPALLSLEDDPDRAFTAAGLVHYLFNQPEAAERRELLRALASAGHREAVVDFFIRFHDVFGLLEDVDAVADYLDADRLITLLRLARSPDAMAQMPLKVERRLLAALAACGPDEAVRALGLARADSSSGPADAAVALALSKSPEELPNVAHEIQDETLRCCALSVMASGHPTAAEDLLSAVKTFHHSLFAVALLRALLPTVPPGELGRADALALGEALSLPGEPPNLDGFLVRHLRRVAKEAGPEAAGEVARRMYSLRREVQDSLLAVALSPESPDVRARLKEKLTATFGHDDISNAVIRVVALPNLDTEGVSDRLDEILDGIPRDLLQHDPRVGALLLSALPEGYRYRKLDSILPTGFLDGHTWFRDGETWALAAEKFVMAFDAEHLNRLLIAVPSWNRESWYRATAELTASAAVRLVELGDANRGMALVAQVPFTRERTAALATMAEYLPASDLPQWANTVTADMNGVRPDTRGARAIAWARAAQRWPELSPPEGWSIVRTWLREARHDDRQELMTDLLGLLPLVLGVGEPDQVKRLIAELGLPNHSSDAQADQP